MFRLFLIRHAQSQNNAKLESERVSDPGITETGTRQAALLGDHFASLEFGSLICSGFRRALQTAEFLRPVHRLTPEVVIDLHEHGGCYSGWHPENFRGEPGLNAEEIQAEFGKVHLPSELNSAGWWKSMSREAHGASDERAERVSRLLKNRLEKSTVNIVCVSHADFLAKLLLAMFGNSIQEHATFFDLKNVGVTEVGLDGFNWKLYQLNSVDFLPDELVTS